MVTEKLHGDHGKDALKYVNSSRNLKDLLGEGHDLLVTLLTDNKRLTVTSSNLKMKKNKFLMF